MKYPALSIIIPCYNEEKLVAKCLWHILKQTVLPEEVIFVDNNSTDKSIEIAEGFIDKFKDVGVEFKILKEEQQGQTFARLNAFSKVKNDLIGSLDTDTLISKDWVKTAKEIFSKKENIIAISGPFYFYNLSIFSKIHFFFVFLMYSIFKPTYILWGGNVVFKKQIYESIGGLEGCEVMRKELKLKQPSDDVFLTEKFKLVGKVKFIWKLKAKGLSRYEKGRTSEETSAFFKVKKYIRKKYKK
ncbi:MAG: glycosyltransferase family A protein [Patescibacteria group bacterium]